MPCDPGRAIVYHVSARSMFAGRGFAVLMRFAFTRDAENLKGFVGLCQTQTDLVDK